MNKAENLQGMVTHRSGAGSKDPGAAAGGRGWRKGNTTRGKNNLSLVRIQGSTTANIFTHADGSDIQDIGLVTVSLDPFNHTVILCRPPFEPWDNGYEYTVVTALTSAGIRPFSNIIRSDNPIDLNWKVSVQNPIIDDINILISKTLSEQNRTSIRLVNTTGQLILEHHFDAIAEHISLSVEALSAGLYILQIKNGNNIQSIKVVKAE